MKLLALCLLLLSAAFGADSAPLWNYPQRLVQPDGSVVSCFASGDEYYHWLHDAQNYTIVQDSRTGYFVYAVLENGTLAPSPHIVGKVNPATLGLPRGVSNPSTAVRGRREQAPARMGVVPQKARAVGTINNIVIFIRFADESREVFPDSTSKFGRMFNSSAAGANSMYNYFNEVSYGQLAITSTLYPVATDSVLSYQDSHVRNYYRPYNAVTNLIGYTYAAEASNREQAMLVNAVNAVASQISPLLDIDADNNGFVDNVCFIVSGNVDAWADLLWPHMAWLSQQASPINGKQVGDYNFQLRNDLVSPSTGVYVLAHEMFHSLGSPDLYHYSFNGLAPAHNWDLMDGSPNPPVHMSAYMKYRYGGWIDSIPTVTAPGIFVLSPLRSATNNCYRILSPFSTSEYFVVEYRKRSGTFESSLPGEGMLVYRINTGEVGNADGPPDEVYVYRPDGLPWGNGTLDSAAYSSSSGRVALTDLTNPSSFLSDGSPGGLNLTDVGFLGDTITFTLGLSNKAILSVHTQAIEFGRIDINVPHRDSTFALTNAGGVSDSVYLTLDYVNVEPASAVEISPVALELPPFESRPVAFTIRPRLLATGIWYNVVVMIDSRFGFGRTHYEKTMAFAISGTLNAVQDVSTLPTAFGLAQNYPNPFNPSTTITYQLPRASHVKLTVYDILGREACLLVNDTRGAGTHEVKVDGSNLASGVYFYRLQAGDFVRTRRLLLMR